MGRILCVGAAVVDFLFRLDELPDKAEKYGTEDAEIVGGGCAANAAVAIARLGGDAVLAARLGDDFIGDMIVADIEREGVDVSNVTRNAGGLSSFSSVFVDKAGERQIVNFRGRDLVLRTDWFDRIEGLGAVLTDTRRIGAAKDALDLARKREVPGVLDGEAPIDPALLSKCSHAALSMQGLRDLCPEMATDDALHSVRQTHGCWTCVTDGERGVWYTDNGSIAHQPAFAVAVTDTLGAGDVWHGVFTMALADGQDERRAIVRANAAAALKCMTSGGRAGAPTRSRLDDFLKENEK